MMKKKIAFLMTAAMLAASVLPTGMTAYAEDAVTVDMSAVEAISEEALEKVESSEEMLNANDVALTAEEEIGTVQGNEDTRQEAEEVLEEELDEALEEELNADVPEGDESAVGDTAQNISAADGSTELVIDDIEMVNETRPCESSQEMITSINIDNKPLTYDATTWRSIFRLPVTITYADGSSKQDSLLNWKPVNIDGMGCLQTMMSDGNMVTLTLWKNGQQVTPPEPNNDSSSFPVGTFTIKLLTGDREWDSLSVTIEDKEFDNLPQRVEFPAGESGNCMGYRIPAESVERRLWVDFQGTEDDDPEILNVFLYRKESDNQEYICQYPEYFKEDSSEEETYFVLEAGQEYMLILNRSFYTVSAYSVTFNIEQKKNVQSVTLDTEGSYSPFTLYECFRNLSAVVKYDSEEERINGGWGVDYDGHTILQYETSNGNLINISFWDGKNQIDIPSEYNAFVGNLTIKIDVDSKRINEVTVKVTVPDTVELPSQTVLAPGQTLCFDIMAHSRNRTLKIQAEKSPTETVHAFLYLVEGGRLSCESYDNYPSAGKPSSLEIKAGKRYLLVLKDGSMETGDKISFTFEEEKSVQSDPATVTDHRWSAWSIPSSGKAVRVRTCADCGATESQPFTPALTLTANNLTMKTKQSTAKFKVTAMAEGDSLVSVTSNNTKVLKVTGINADGTFKLKAQKKTGTVKLTIKLKSGATRTIKVKVQKPKVKTTKIKVASKKLTLSKKQKYKLAPVITPVTSQDKVKYTSSNKKVATVNSKGQITAKKKGTATITVKSGEKAVKVKVTVK